MSRRTSPQETPQDFCSCYRVETRALAEARRNKYYCPSCTLMLNPNPPEPRQNITNSDTHGHTPNHQSQTHTPDQNQSINNTFTLTGSPTPPQRHAIQISDTSSIQEIEQSQETHRTAHSRHSTPSSHHHISPNRNNSLNGARGNRDTGSDLPQLVNEHSEHGPSHNAPTGNSQNNEITPPTRQERGNGS